MNRPRRTISFDQDIDDGVLHYRGKYLMETLKDKDHSTAVNELLREILQQKGFIEK
jgi:hypothetical protein